VGISGSAVITGSYGVVSRYQTTGHYTSDWEDSVRAVVSYRVWELAVAL
jgi:hypothetical protein